MLSFLVLVIVLVVFLSCLVQFERKAFCFQLIYFGRVYLLAWFGIAGGEFHSPRLPLGVLGLAGFRKSVCVQHKFGFSDTINLCVLVFKFIIANACNN